MCVKDAVSVFLVLSSVCMPAVAGVDGLSLAQAKYAAEASIQLIPGSDIEFDHHAHKTAIAYLDQNRVPEIVYLLTAVNTGSSFDATNDLIVMTRLKEGDKRGLSPYPGSSEVMDGYYAEIRKSGYADDARIHIPGEVERLYIREDERGGKIEVVFIAKEDSPICRRFVETNAGKKVTKHCPPPGWHNWVYAWTPGKLKRVECLSGSAEKIHCNPDHDGG
jgi:hypothetical protein